MARLRGRPWLRRRLRRGESRCGAAKARPAPGLLEPVRDLGALRGPLIAFGGPLSNLDALNALMAEARAFGIAPAAMISTGDVAAYGAEPGECARTLEAAGVPTVMGNCEEALTTDAADCGCDFVPGSTCDALSGAWYRYAREHTSPEARAWMGGLPRRIAFTLGGARIAVIHGGAKRINRYLFASNRAALAEELAWLGADVVIAGHAGIPFTTDVPGGLWHNPGTLGLPANDGTARVWYSVISARNGELAFEHRALRYDSTAQARKMREAGLPEPYAQALETGLWPDAAILPAPEAAVAGKPLRALTVGWRVPVPAPR